ncbi:sensor histidine kinase, partial [Limnofasciculus baicalensis]
SPPTPKNPLPTPSIIIRISDNGYGISEEVINRIFDPFFTTKSVGAGAGLGLSISYQIVVNRHGGKMKCNSVVGEGTEFVIELPIAPRKIS